MIQLLSPEIGKIVEKRHEMILAHEKFEVKIKDLTRLSEQLQKQGLKE